MESNENKTETQFCDLPKDWAWRAKRAGKTLKDLAKEVGVSYPTISGAFNGHTDPRGSTISKAEEVLKAWGV